MTKNQYLEQRYTLLSRLDNAKKNLCVLTARARCRDLAKLKTEFDGSDYDANLLELQAENGLLFVDESVLK